MNYIEITGLSDVGIVRKNNEDSFDYSEDIFSVKDSLPKGEFPIKENAPIIVLADGMGGENGGEIASFLAVNSIRNYLAKNFHDDISDVEKLEMLKKSLIEAHNKILDHGRLNTELIGMGTTVIVGVISKGLLYLSWVGDSRAYVFNPLQTADDCNYKFNNGLKLLTDDHSLVWQQVINGLITPEEARISPNSNVITQSLGDPFHIPIPDCLMTQLNENDILLFCSDGLNGMLSDDKISSILQKNYDDSLHASLEDLLVESKLAGGKDNITLILTRMKNDLTQNRIQSINQDSHSSQYLRDTIKVSSPFHVKTKRSYFNKRNVIILLFLISTLVFIYHFNISNYTNKIAINPPPNKKLKLNHNHNVDTLKIYTQPEWINCSKQEIERYSIIKNDSIK